MNTKWNRSLWWIGGIAAVVLLVLWLGIVFILPVYVQSRVIPQVVADLGLEVQTVQVRRIGLWGADLGPMAFQVDGLTVFSLAAVQVDYDPLTLLSRRIKGITLGGLAIQVTTGPEGVTVAGFKKPAVKTGHTGAGAALDLKTVLPVGLDRVSILQSRAVLNHQGRRYEVPFDINLNTAQLRQGKVWGQIHLSILGQPLKGTVAVDPQAKVARFSLQCHDFALESLAAMAGFPERVSVYGGMHIDADAAFDLNSFELKEMAVSGRLVDLRIITPKGRLESQAGGLPVALSISANGPGRIQWACGPLQFSGAMRAALTALTGEWTAQAEGWTADTLVEALLPDQPLPGGWMLKKTLPLKWRIQALQAKGQPLGFSLQSVDPPAVSAGSAAVALLTKSLQVVLKGQWTGQWVTAEGSVDLGPVQVSLLQGKAGVSNVKLDCGLTLALSDPSASKTTAQVALGQVQFNIGDIQGGVSGLQLTVDGHSDDQATWKWDGRLTVADGKIEDKPHRLLAEGFSLALPLQWPPGPRVAAGRLKLPVVQWNGRSIGGVSGAVQQKGLGITIGLAHQSKLFPGLSVLINGDAGAAEISGDFRIPAYRPPRAVDLGRLIPAMKGFEVAGRLTAHGQVAMAPDGIAGKAAVVLDQGTLNHTESELQLEGIQMAFELTDLVAMKSAPRQKLSVRKLQLGELAAQNLDVDFQLEDRQTLFVEKVGLQWCKGRINTAALRITVGKAAYDVTLFCDRLNLAMVLAQLGAAEADGEGTVNGRIPVRWADKRLSFDNGFLYSTPGQPGVIHLSGTEKLLSGMPSGTPQYTQLDIATEALRDYTYQWAKLSVQTEKDTLFLKLQLDGRPNRLLPFAYNQELGQFMRISGEGQADFKGINIDLNFKSPLNEIIHYREFLNRK